MRRSRHAWRAAAIVLACGWLADRYALPALAGRSVRDALTSGGYPEARFEVETVGLDRVQLRGVHLADGVDLGQVELDVGLSALWGDRPERATIRGARIELDAVKPGPDGGGHGGGGDSGGSSGSGGGSAGGPPIRRVRVERAELTRGGDRATVTGDISLAGPFAADLHATGVQIGGVAIEDAALHVREAGGGRYDAAWELRGASWTARGDGVVARGAGAPELVRSHTELRARTLRAGDLSIEGVHARLDIAGPLAAPEVRGEARADRAELAGTSTTVTLRDLRMPIAARARFDGGALAVLGRPPVARAGEATLEVAGHQLRGTELALELGDGDGSEARPLLTLGRGEPWPARVRWRAAGARGGMLRAEQLTGSYDTEAATHAIAWRSLAASSLELGRGELLLRRTGGLVRLERARLEAAGGELTAGPVALGGELPVELVVAARGLELGRLLPRRSVAATAVLDGKAALRLAGGGVTFVRGELRARGRGTIRVSDPELRRRAGAMAGLEQRLVSALADFEHTTLAAELGPPGSEPELRITARGRGTRVPQELDLAINFRGVWATLDRLARSSR